MRSEPRSARTPVWPLSISLAATLEIDKFSFSSSPYLDVSVQAVPLHTLWIGVWMHEVCSCGFPHSDICGSVDICSSPQLFAAYHVFHRLLVPRHPPCALFCLTFVTSYHSVGSIVFCSQKKSLVCYFFSDVLIFDLTFVIIFYLSYLLLCEIFKVHFLAGLLFPAMETERFELLTPCLQGRCSPN